MNDKKSGKPAADGKLNSYAKGKNIFESIDDMSDRVMKVESTIHGNSEGIIIWPHMISPSYAPLCAEAP